MLSLGPFIPTVDVEFQHHSDICDFPGDIWRTSGLSGCPGEKDSAGNLCSLFPGPQNSQTEPPVTLSSLASASHYC